MSESNGGDEVGAPAAPLVQMEEGAAGVAPVVGMLAKTVAGLQVRKEKGRGNMRDLMRCVSPAGGRIAWAWPTAAWPDRCSRAST
jgi:hypothetical protein